jgi:hypothetical protein
MKTSWVVWVVRALTLALLLSVIACGDGGKAAADAAIAASQSAFDSAKVEAAKYAPDQVAEIDRALAAIKDVAAKGSYTQAIADAQGMASRIAALGEAAAAKKAALATQWTALSGGLPGVVDAIKSRVDMLSASRRLPAGLTADALAAAKTGLATLTQAWTDATAAFSSGDVMGAVAKAQTVKAKAAEVMQTLGMQVPDALKADR